MPLQAKQNLPLFVAKRATISIAGLPEISTISINVIKRPDENINPGLSTGIVRPTVAPHQSDSEIHFVELPQINYDENKGSIPPPVFNGANPPPPANTNNDKRPYVCNAVLDLVRIPDEWIAKQGQEIPVIQIRLITGQRTLTQAVFMFDEKSGGFFIQAKGFL
jgi:hypothetical protein